jgi:type IV pilus assembly protein PilW
MGRILFRNKGFTLIELLVALVISSILVAALYRTFIRQQKTYTIQDQVADMQQNARAAMDIITRHVRMAGYDPQKTGNFGFQATDSDGRSTDSTNIAFTIDYNENGVLENNEQIAFKLDGLLLKKYVTGQWVTMAENMESLSFLYKMSDGTETSSPSNPANIRMVKATIKAKTSIQDPEYGSGGGYRKRVLTSYIQVRNMGL